MRNKSTIYLTGHFHYYLVSYNTTGVLHSFNLMSIYIAPFKLSSVKNEFSSEGLPVLHQEHSAGMQNRFPSTID